MDKKKIDNFWNNRTKISDARIATNYRDDGRLAYDIQLVSKYVAEGDKILDLGAGTCTLSTAFLDKAQEIIAVDKFEGFFNLAPKHLKLKTHCADIIDFKSDKQFDLILLFGVVNFITIEEEKMLYQTCYSMLKNEGLLIVKNQCGVNEEVIVDNYSQELKTDYHARYPFVESQHKRLTEFFEVEQIDIYPKEINVWSNTHFYAFVSRKL